MTLTKQQVREVLDVYIRAWEGQDPHLIGTIFTEGATYHERVMGEPIRGRDGIRDYWQTKVVGTQANITCELLNLFLDDGTAIAEWEETAPHATSRPHTTPPSAARLTSVIARRREVTRGGTNHPSINGKDGAAGSIAPGFP